MSALLASTPMVRGNTDRSANRSVLPGWLPLVILAITIVLIFYKLLAGQVLFWGLPALQFQPWRTFAIAELRAGRLPLWNPLNGAGEPLIANYQLGFFYPPTLIGLLIAPDASGLGWLGMLHLFWAGVGMWWYARRLGMSTFARGVGVLAYALNGAVVARFGTLPMVEAAAWLPWLLFTAERLLGADHFKAQIWRTSWFALTVTMLLLIGHAQWAFYSLALTGLYIGYRLLVTPINILRTGRAPILVLFAIGGLLALGIAAVQLVPTAELQAQSQRAGGADESFALNFSDQPQFWLTQFDPFLYGNPGDGTYTLKGEYFEFASYIGLLPVILALFAIIMGILRWRRWRPIKTGQLSIAVIPFFAVIAAIGFWFSLGKNTPLYVFLYRHVPTFNQFQAPSRWLLWSVIGLSVLAALGASIWQPKPNTWRRARLIQMGGLIVIALDLLWANSLLNPTTSADFYAPHLTNQPQSGRTFQTDAALNDAEFNHFLLVTDYRAASLHRDEYRSSGLPNLNLLDSIRSLNLFEPLRIASIDRYTSLLNSTPTPGLYRAAAIATTNDPQPPRMWLVGKLTPITDPFVALIDPAWNPSVSGIVAANVPALDSPVDPADKATFITDSPQELVIATHSAHPAALIVADTWYPGWIATIDNQPTPIMQVNGAFRSVIVPAGDHRVTMSYQPDSLKIGSIISVISLFALIALIIGGVIIRPPSRMIDNDKKLSQRSPYT